MSKDFDYKKISLQQFDNLLTDLLSCDEIPPQEIYDTIIKSVRDSVNYHEHQLARSKEILDLLSVDYFPRSNPGPGITSATQKDWNSFWEENWYPEEYTKEQEREFNLKEQEYQDKRAKLDATYSDMVKRGYIMTADGIWIKSGDN